MWWVRCVVAVGAALRSICDDDPKHLYPSGSLEAEAVAAADEMEQSSALEMDDRLRPTFDIGGYDDLPVMPEEAAGGDVAEPGWIQEISDACDKLLSFASSVGVELNEGSEGGSEYLDRACPKNAIVDRGICVVETLIGLMAKVKTVGSVVGWLPHIIAGGHKAKEALLRLNAMKNDPTALKTMTVLQYPFMLKALTKKESTPDLTRGLALNLLSGLDDRLPSHVSVADVNTGSFAHLDILTP